MYILVIDVGTSSMRGMLFDEQGKALDVCQYTYQVEIPAPGVVEQNPEVWTGNLVSIVSILNQRAVKAGRKIDAISLTCQRSSLIPVNRQGQPLRKCIMWQDSRSAEVIDKLKPWGNRVEELTGARLNTVFSGAKMAWFKATYPDLYSQTYKLLTIADYLTLFMTGQFVTDETYASRSSLMGIASRKWEPELLSIFGIEEEKLCRILPPGSVAGPIRQSFADEVGLSERIPVIMAGGDQQCGALGQGVVESGVVEITVGTGAYVLMQVDKPVDVRGKGVVCGAHSIPGTYVIETNLLTCAALYNWVDRTIFGQYSYDEINREVAAVAPGSEGCICIPYFQGRGTPDWNSNAGGAFLNLNLGSTRGVMARAALESIAYEVQNNMLTVSSLSGSPTCAHVGGGLTNQPQFCQILSDTMGLTMLREVDFAEQTARGAWISAAVTLGLYASYAEAYKSAVDGSRMLSYHADPDRFRIYEQGRQQMNEHYRNIYL